MLAPALRRGQRKSTMHHEPGVLDRSEAEMTLSTEQIDMLANCIWGAVMSVLVGLMIWATDD